MQTELFIEYQQYTRPIRQFISRWLILYLIDVNQVRSCYGLAMKYNEFLGFVEDGTEKYWYQVINGSFIRNRRKIENIERFQPGATQYLCHPICFILNIPLKYYVTSQYGIVTRRMPPRLVRTINLKLKAFENDNEEKDSVCLQTIDRLYPLVLTCYNSYAKHDFESAKSITDQINKILNESKEQWRYPKTAKQLMHLIQSRLQYLNHHNKLFSA